MAERQQERTVGSEKIDIIQMVVAEKIMRDEIDENEKGNKEESR